MADLAKNAIKASFIRLLNEKPLKKIRVLDIVEDCQINRNTFYYHYQDIPDLIEHILEDNFQRLLQDNPKLETVEDCVNTVIDSIMENRKAILHIYKSANRALFEQYHWRICQKVINSYMDQKLQGIRISDSDRTIITAYMESLVFGIVMGWLENDLKENIQTFTRRIFELKQGDLEAMIEKCKL